MTRSMNKKLIFFDFDGTLYSHTSKQVPVENIRALKMLQRMGHTIIVATGRGAETIKFIQDKIKTELKTFIVLNGQMIYEDGKIVYDNHINLASMDHIIRIAKENDIAYGGYYTEGEIVNVINERVKGVWKSFNAPIPYVQSNFQDHFHLYQGHLYITKEESSLFGKYLDEYVTNWSDPYLVNLIPKTAGKSQAIRWCMQKYQFTKENTFAFGDGFNDRDMLLEVGHGVAMGNAIESIKEIAEFVTESVDNNGIEIALKHYKILDLECGPYLPLPT